MKILLLILGFFASAFGMVEALVLYVIKGSKYHKAYLFTNKFGFVTDEMRAAFARPLSYHNLKNLWPTWLEDSQERASKAIALLVLVLIIIIGVVI